ncbi:hypothetical protein QQ045_013991 [Rhodiola kirilowii]
MQMTHLPRVSSDHCPLLLSLSQKIKIKRGFKFSAAWIMHDNFLTLVSTHWADHAHDNPLRNFAMKLKRLGRCLTKWNCETFGNVHKLVIEKENLVDSLEKRLQSSWNNDTHLEVVQAKKDLSTYLRYQYNMLEEKSRIDWLRDGDRNTNLMHASIKARRIYNTVRLLLEDGSYTDDVDTIGRDAVNHFKALFGDFPNHTEISIDNLIHSSVTESDNTTLCRLLDEEEIRDTLIT